MGGMMDGSGMGNGFFGVFFSFGLFILILIIAIFLIARWMMNSNSRGRSQVDRGRSESSSEETLNRRLASGEITEEEYDRLKKKIRE